MIFFVLFSIGILYLVDALKIENQKPEEFIKSPLENQIDVAFRQMETAMTESYFNGQTGIENLGSLEAAAYQTNVEEFVNVLVDKISENEKAFIDENFTLPVSDTKNLYYLMDNWVLDISVQEVSILQLNNLLIRIKSDTFLTSKKEKLKDKYYYLLLKPEKDSYRLLSFIGPTEEQK